MRNVRSGGNGLKCVCHIDEGRKRLRWFYVGRAIEKQRFCLSVLKNYVVSGVLDSEPLSGATPNSSLDEAEHGQATKGHQNVTLIGAGINEIK